MNTVPCPCPACSSCSKRGESRGTDLFSASLQPSTPVASAQQCREGDRFLNKIEAPIRTWEPRCDVHAQTHYTHACGRATPRTHDDATVASSASISMVSGEQSKGHVSQPDVLHMCNWPVMPNHADIRHETGQKRAPGSEWCPGTCKTRLDPSLPASAAPRRSSASASRHPELDIQSRQKVVLACC